MADDKKKDDKKDDGKKKGLPPIVLVAVGAILGGAGVVFAIPPKTVEVPVEAPVYEDIDVTNPDELLVEFNPRTRAGKGVGRLGFKFVFTVREDREHEAYEKLKENWDYAKSSALLLFKTRSMEELNTEAGIRVLEHDLIEAMNKAFFQGSDVARVSRVMWTTWLLQ